MDRSHDDPEGMLASEDHYLRREFMRRLKTDDSLIEFLEKGSLDGIWYWDLENPDHEWMSPQFWELLGYDPAEKEHLAAEWADLIHPDDLKTAYANFEAHCADPTHPYDQVVRYRHADGSTVWVRCRGLAIRDDSGKPVRMLGAHNDLTARKVTEEAFASRLQELEQLQAELKRSNADLEQFAYAASHDLQEPLRTIGSFTEILAATYEDSLDERGRRYVGYVTEASQRMQALIDGLLDYSRLGTREVQPCDAAEALQAALTVLEPLSTESGGTVTHGDLPTVMVDRGQLERVFLNLVGNSLKFCGDSAPQIRIEAAPRGSLWAFSVRDEGIGIAPEHHDRVFQAFKKLHSHAEHSGSGLGLALAKRVVVGHGGEIWVKSSLGEGTTVHFTLPGPRQS